MKLAIWGVIRSYKGPRDLNFAIKLCRSIIKYILQSIPSGTSIHEPLKNRNCGIWAKKEMQKIPTSPIEAKSHGSIPTKRLTTNKKHAVNLRNKKNATKGCYTGFLCWARHAFSFTPVFFFIFIFIFFFIGIQQVDAVHQFEDSGSSALFPTILLLVITAFKMIKTMNSFPKIAPVCWC